MKEVKVYLDDILESIKKIEKYIADLTPVKFDENSTVQDAVMRRLERIMRGLDKEEKANPAMAKRIAQKLRPFTEKLYYEGLIGRKITWNEQENIERVEERIRNLSCESG